MVGRRNIILTCRNAEFLHTFRLSWNINLICSLMEYKMLGKPRNLRLLQHQISTHLGYTVVWYKFVIHRGISS